MGKRLSLIAGCAIAAIFAAGHAVGADLPPPPLAPSLAPPPPMAPPPPPTPVVEHDPSGSCLYARLDGGYAIHSRPKVYKNGGSSYSNGSVGTSYALGEEFDDSYVIDAGVGCYINNYLRGDITVGYRSASKVKDSYNSLSAEVSSYTAMINGYFDIGHFGGITPYVGVGVGVAHNVLSNVTLPAGQKGGRSTHFAWALHAGASLQVTETMLVDASYRYIDLGKVKGSSGADPIHVDNLTAHDIRIGLRINLD